MKQNKSIDQRYLIALGVAVTLLLIVLAAAAQRRTNSESKAGPVPQEQINQNLQATQPPGANQQPPPGSVGPGRLRTRQQPGGRPGVQGVLPGADDQNGGIPQDFYPGGDNDKLN